MEPAEPVRTGTAASLFAKAEWQAVEGVQAGQAERGGKAMQEVQAVIMILQRGEPAAVEPAVLLELAAVGAAI